MCWGEHRDGSLLVDDVLSYEVALSSGSLGLTQRIMSRTRSVRVSLDFVNLVLGKREWIIG